MMVSSVRGRFTGLSGTTVDAGEDPKLSSVKAAIDVTTLITGDPRRDEHLRSADFFDVAKYPWITFESRRISGPRDRFIGGVFEGAPMVLLHHRGRKSGREYLTPTTYL